MRTAGAVADGAAVTDGATVAEGDADGATVVCGWIVGDADGRTEADASGVAPGNVVEVAPTVAVGVGIAVAVVWGGVVDGDGATVGVTTMPIARAGVAEAPMMHMRPRSNAARHHARHRVTRSHRPVGVRFAVLTPL